MRKIEVLVVDDSAFMRKMISNILESHARIKVIDTARHGQDAIDKLKKYSPDVITLDIEMPIMDGITTLKQIMADKPTPVIMLSSLTKEGADKTLESMELGAVDFIGKPSGSISLNIQDIEDEIITKVLEAAMVKVECMKRPMKKPTKKPIVNQRLEKPLVMKSSSRSGEPHLIAIGTSTGGPRALQQVITHLPENIAAPIVIVQHMPAGFTKSLANRLDQLSEISVKEAEDGDILENGTAYVAPGGFQFRVVDSLQGFKIKVSKEENRNGHQPAVDVLFESLAELKKVKLTCVVMTGMGSDGANGLIEIKHNKPDTFIISEAKESCVVYGMPQAAEKTKLVNEVVELPKISDAIVNQLKARGE